jgi:hypothetical protein
MPQIPLHGRAMETVPERAQTFRPPMPMRMAAHIICD